MRAHSERAKQDGGSVCMETFPSVSGHSVRNLWIAAFTCIALRLIAIWVIPPIYDEMVQLYMANDIGHLLRFPAYFDQQRYMGPFESYFLAPFLRIFGFSYLSGRLFNQIFYVGFIFLWVKITRRFFSEKLTVPFLFVLALLPSFALIFTATVGFVEILFLASLALWILLRISETQKATGWSLALGFVCGLALWTNPLFVVWAVPIASILAWVIPAGRKKNLLMFSAGVALGLFPIGLDALFNHEHLFLQGGGSRFSSLSEIPQMLYFYLSRMKTFFSVPPAPDGIPFSAFMKTLSFIVLFVLMLPFGIFTFSSLRHIKDFNLQEKIFRLFVILPPFALCGFYVARNLVGDEGMRFFLPLVISFPFCLAWWAGLPEKTIFRKTVLGVYLCMSFILMAVSLHVEYRETRKLMVIKDFLNEKNLRYGISEMTLSYPLHALSRGEIIVTPVHTQARNLAIWEQVREKGPQFFVAEHADQPAQRILGNDSFLSKKNLGDYDVFYGKSPKLTTILDEGLKE